MLMSKNVSNDISKDSPIGSLCYTCTCTLVKCSLLRVLLVYDGGIWCNSHVLCCQPRVLTMHLINPFRSVGALMALIDFNMSNVRRFYLSMGNPLAVKGLKEVNIENTNHLQTQSTKYNCWNFDDGRQVLLSQ